MCPHILEAVNGNVVGPASMSRSVKPFHGEGEAGRYTSLFWHRSRALNPLRHPNRLI